MSNWYVIYTNAGQEFLVISELKKQNFKVYLPLINKVVKHARKIREVAKPFFPRYLFVYLNTLKDQWSKINYTRGVVNILSSDGCPTRLPEEIIFELKLLESNKGLINHIPLVNLEKGDNIEILSGPFQGITGKFDGLNDKLRVRVLLDFMGRNIKVPLYNEWIDKV